MKAGFSLIELLLALGITSFAIMGVVALMPVGLRNYKDSREETSAMAAIQVVQNYLKASHPDPSANLRIGTAPSSILQSGKASSVVFYLDQALQPQSSSLQSLYRVGIDYFPPPTRADGTASLYPVAAHVVISWPAVVETKAARGRVEAYLTFPVPGLP